MRRASHAHRRSRPTVVCCSTRYPEFEILERQINGLPGFHPLTQQLKLLVDRLGGGNRTGQRGAHPDSAAAA
jgi:hypothetical protein